MASNSLQPTNSTSITFDLYSILSDIGKRFAAILLCGCFCAMGCYIYKTETYTPIYKTSATFIVNDKNESRNVYNNLNTTTTLAKVFLTILDSEQFQEQVAENLDVKKIPGTITASQVPNTNMISIQTTANTPFYSYTIMQSILEIYPNLTGEVISNAVMDALESPVVPTKPSNSAGTLSFSLLGFGAGVLVYTAIILLFSFFKDTLKNQEEVNKKLTTPLLVAIPKEKKRRRFLHVLNGNKIPLNINSPTQSFQFIEAFKKLRTEVESASRNNGFKTFVVTSTLENEGKSTVAANLALSLVKKGHKVLLIDADLRKPAMHRFFDIKVERSQRLSLFLAGKARLSSLIIHDEVLNLDFILDNEGHKNASDLLATPTLEYLLNTVKQQYDYIIIDTPPLALIADAEELLHYTDAALLVARQDTAYSTAVNDTIDIIQNSPSELLGCVYNGAYGILNRKNGYGYGGSYSDYGYGYDLNNNY